MKPEADTTQNFVQGLAMAGFAVMLLTLSVLFYVIQKIDDRLLVLAKIETLGQIGDFIGGVLNPIFGLLMLFAVLKTLQIQRSEMSKMQEIADRSNEGQVDTANLNALIALIAMKQEYYRSVNDSDQQFFMPTPYSYAETERRITRLEIDSYTGVVNELLEKYLNKKVHFSNHEKQSMHTLRATNEQVMEAGRRRWSKVIHPVIALRRNGKIKSVAG